MFSVQWTYKLQRVNSQQHPYTQGGTHRDSQGQPAEELQSHGVSYEFWDQQVKSQRKDHIIESCRDAQKAERGCARNRGTNTDTATAAVFARKRSSLSIRLQYQNRVTSHWFHCLRSSVPLMHSIKASSTDLSFFCPTPFHLNILPKSGGINGKALPFPP